MSGASPRFEILGPEDRLVMIVGSYGSGKTEVAVNLAIRLAKSGRRVQIADLDIVNPYFRSREARGIMEAHDIRVVVPPGAQAWADLPIILPEIQGMLRPPEDMITLFDVGGDDIGAKVLSSFQPALPEGSYELWQVVNGNRPFTGTAEGCHAMRRALEASSRLRVTGLVGNSHLIEETTATAVLAGWNLVSRVSEESRLPVRCVAVLEALADDPALAEITAPLLRLERLMLPPWLTSPSTEGEDAEVLPAARPIPIGKPPPVSAPPPRGDVHGLHQD
ncbi:MAG: nucleotide-binding protein [Planctomycetota bacterium]|jgi:hypothetical protein